MLWFELALIPILIGINGFFVAAEFAIIAVRRTRVEQLVNENVPRAQALMEAIINMNTSVAAAQLGITIASLALGFVSEPALHHLISPLFEQLPEGWQGPVSRSFSVLLTLGFITYMHVVFGEQVPKLAALEQPERFSLLVAVPLNWVAKMTSWPIKLMNGSSSLFLKMLGFKLGNESTEVHTTEELRLLIEDTHEAGLLDKKSANYLLNVFALSNKRVRDAMVPIDRASALEIHMTTDDILKAVKEGAHTRMPVYDRDINNVVGVVNTKDLFYLFTLKNVVALHDALYSPSFLDADITVAEALKQFQSSHRHMAIVRDQEKKVLGLITLEDVLEEIVGDLEDEHDLSDKRKKR